MNFGFKTYKTQYEEASAEVASLKKLNDELTEKVTSLEKLNAELSAKTVEQLISKEDLDKLNLEHATLSQEKSELVAKVTTLEKEKVDVEELASKQAALILAEVGIKKPFVAKSSETVESDNVFSVAGKEYRIVNL